MNLGTLPLNKIVEVLCTNCRNALMEAALTYRLKKEKKLEVEPCPECKQKIEIITKELGC